MTDNKYSAVYQYLEVDWIYAYEYLELTWNVILINFN